MKNKYLSALFSILVTLLLAISFLLPAIAQTTVITVTNKIADKPLRVIIAAQALQSATTNGIFISGRDNGINRRIMYPGYLSIQTESGQTSYLSSNSITLRNDQVRIIEISTDGKTLTVRRGDNSSIGTYPLKDSFYNHIDDKSYTITYDDSASFPIRPTISEIVAHANSASSDDNGADSGGNSGADSAGNSGANSSDNSGANSSDNSGAGSSDNSGAGSSDNSGAGSSDNSGADSSDNSGAGSSDNSGAGSTDKKNSKVFLALNITLILLSIAFMTFSILLVRQRIKPLEKDMGEIRQKLRELKTAIGTKTAGVAETPTESKSLQTDADCGSLSAVESTENRYTDIVKSVSDAYGGAYEALNYFEAQRRVYFLSVLKNPGESMDMVRNTPGTPLEFGQAQRETAPYVAVLHNNGQCDMYLNPYKYAGKKLAGFYDKEDWISLCFECYIDARQREWRIAKPAHLIRVGNTTQIEAKGIIHLQ